MLTHERTLEQYLVDGISEATEKLNVTILSVVHNAADNVLDVRFQLPAWADRTLRHDLLHVLADFERAHDHGVIVNPTFLWSEPDA